MADAEIVKWLGGGWTLHWSEAKSEFGRCVSGKQQIWLSKVLVALNDEAEMMDTVRHEIAHALTDMEWVRNGGRRPEAHGPEWRRNCLVVGATPSRLASGKTPKAKWTGYCPTPLCDGQTSRQTLFKGARSLACSACCKKYNGGRWDARFVYVWKENR